MNRNIVAWVLVASLSFYIGCYNTEMVPKEELKAKVGQADITVYTKDSLEYEFSKENYRIRGDTLAGYGIRKWNVSTDVVYDASLSFADIDSIETREFLLERTMHEHSCTEARRLRFCLCGGILRTLLCDT